MGYGVNDDEVFTEVLERLVPDTEVINMGVTGYGTSQEIAYFTREGLRYSPDLLILAFCLNDVFRQGLIEKASDRAEKQPPPQEAERTKERKSAFQKLKNGFQSHRPHTP